MACVIRGSHDWWSPEDRRRLAELAKTCVSDREIASQMERTVTAIVWQRRKMRIRLVLYWQPRQQRSQPPKKRSVRPPKAEPQNIQRKPPVVECAEFVDRLMDLIGKAR